MRGVQRERAAAVALDRAGGDQQVRVALHQVDVGGPERLQALRGRGAGAEWSRPGDQRVLELARVLLQQREREARAVAEAAVEGAGADTGGTRDVLHRDVLDPPLVDQPRRRLEDAQAVAGGVGALARRRAVGDQWEVGHMGDHADCSTGARISRQRSPSRSPRRAVSSGSASEPSSSKAPSAMPTGSSASSTCAPDALSALRTSAWAQTAPNRPVLAPITAEGLSLRTLSGNGREAQSSAFLRPPGTEALYSGVAISSASAASISSSRYCTTAGGSDSRSSSKMGRPARPSHSTSSTPDGRVSPAARISRRLWEPRRTLPAMPRIRMTLGLLLDERELDGQGDV